MEQRLEEAVFFRQYFLGTTYRIPWIVRKSVQNSSFGIAGTNLMSSKQFSFKKHCIEIRDPEQKEHKFSRFPK